MSRETDDLRDQLARRDKILMVLLVILVLTTIGSVAVIVLTR